MKLESRTYADTVIVAPTGRLDHDNCEAFRAGLQPHLERASVSRQRIVLDLSRLEYVSSAGLRCFMLAAKEAGSQGGKIVLASLRPVVAEIFQISRFDMLFQIFPSVGQALATVSPSASAAYDGD
jgi:anti-sigma B factor antagonist